MMSKRLSLIATLMLLTALLLTACGNRPVSTVSGTETANPNEFRVELPRVTVEVAPDGTPSIMGITMADFEKLGVPGITPLVVDPAIVSSMQAGNIQHVELLNGGNGLYLFVNGKALPYIEWDQNALTNTASMLRTFYPTLADWVPGMLPLIRSVGLDFVIAMPVPAGATKIDMRAEDAPLPSPPAAGSEQASAIIQLPIIYDATGTPQMMGRGGQLWRLDPAALATLGVSNLPLYLSQDTLNQLMAANVQSLSLETSPAGIQVMVNNQALPQLVWGEQELQNAVDLAGSTGQVNAAVLDLVSKLVPALSTVDARLYMEFPLAKNATAIPQQ